MAHSKVEQPTSGKFQKYARKGKGQEENTGNNYSKIIR